MRPIWVVLTGLVCCGCLWPLAAAAQDPPGERAPGDPIFVKWLRPDDPQDRVILDYWRRAARQELTANELVDLGTMLFHRGYPKDAVRCYRDALDIDPKLYEAWFRIGMVKHRGNEFEDARHAYNRCLKLLVGHGWCNFYLGLLEEQTGHPSEALDHYRRAFKVAPELADPDVNPELLYSDLYVGAALALREQRRFADVAPLRYLDPKQVAAVRSQFEPTPTPVVAAPPTPGVGAGAPAVSVAARPPAQDDTAPVIRREMEPRPTEPVYTDLPFGIRSRTWDNAPARTATPLPSPTSSPGVE